MEQALFGNRHTASEVAGLPEAEGATRKAEVKTSLRDVFPRRGSFRLPPSAFLLAAMIVAALPAAAQPRSAAAVADIALYQGADRAQRLTEGAKKEGVVNVYTSATVEDMSILTGEIGRAHV